MRANPRKIGGTLFPAFLKTAKALPGFLFLRCVLPACLASSGMCQDAGNDMKAKLDEMIAKAYRSAAEKFPCKVKTRRNTEIMQWQQVDSCLNEASDRVDWEGLSRQIQDLRRSSGYSSTDMSAAVESSLSAHAISYDKVFSVKDVDALLPLTNSLLKFLPEGSLMDFPVYEKSGKQIGTFSGAYSFEKTGGLTEGNVFRMASFQYTDREGNIQNPSTLNRLLLDSYGVSWKGAISQPGFRLYSDKLNLKR